MSPDKKINFKNYFPAKLKDREMVKNRVYAKIHTHEIRVYYSLLQLGAKPTGCLDRLQLQLMTFDL